MLGGGQLGKMLAEAGIPLGHEFVFIDPSEQACARVHGQHIVAPFDDAAALQQLADTCDIVTYEFENLPLPSVELIAKSTPVFPSTEALRITQDRLLEKEFCTQIGVQCAAYEPVTEPDALEPAIQNIGYPCILKTRRMGYDGKGQVFLASEADNTAAKELVSTQECILEKCVPFTKECSIVCTRSQDGDIAVYPLSENTHNDGILRLSISPAEVSDATNAKAMHIAKIALEEFSYVGTLAVEMFVLEDGSVLVNEFAPRVHNSGHWTIEGATTSQFSNHIRAITGVQLGSTELAGSSAMVNIIGAVPDLSSIHDEKGVHIHLYGKAERPGRKIGHITIVSDDEEYVLSQSKKIGLLCGVQVKQ